MTPADWLAGHGAQHDVVTWARAHAGDWAALWEACPRGDWLLAIAVRAEAPRDAIVRAAIEVARFGVGGSMPELDAALDRALGPHDAAVLLAEADAIEGRAPADPEVMALSLAVACALRATERSEDAAMVPALVAQAAALGAGDCAMMAAVSYAQKRSAEIVRAAITAADLTFDG